MDNSYITLAAVACTLIVPIATSIINNGHETKMLSVRSRIDNEQRAISEYLKWASVLSDDPKSEFMNEYKKAYGEVFMYVPRDLIDDIKNLNNMIQTRHISKETMDLFDNIADRFSSDCAKKLKSK